MTLLLSVDDFSFRGIPWLSGCCLVKVSPQFLNRSYRMLKSRSLAATISGKKDYLRGVHVRHYVSWSTRVIHGVLWRPMTTGPFGPNYANQLRKRVRRLLLLVFGLSLCCIVDSFWPFEPLVRVLNYLLEIVPVLIEQVKTQSSFYLARRGI